MTPPATLATAKREKPGRSGLHATLTCRPAKAPAAKTYSLQAVIAAAVLGAVAGGILAGGCVLLLVLLVEDGDQSARQAGLANGERKAAKGNSPDLPPGDMTLKEFVL
jgi:hypothetical protein